jgi:hypothetical protein
MAGSYQSGHVGQADVQVADDAEVGQSKIDALSFC